MFTPATGSDAVVLLGAPDADGRPDASDRPEFAGNTAAGRTTQAKCAAGEARERAAHQGMKTAP